MNQKVLRTLEYNKIVEQLAEYAFGADTKERCLSLLPSTSLSEITNAQQQTKDAMNRSLKKGRLDCSGIKPLSSAIRRVEIGGTMNIEELLGLCKLLETARRIKAYGRKEREDIPSDFLSEFFDGLEPLSPLCDEIRRCIISVDEISDDARTRISSNEQNFEDLLSDLEASRITIEKEQAEINRYKSLRKESKVVQTKKQY